MMTTIKECSFRVTLFDDESTRKKLQVMDPIEAVFDDERNVVPDEYYEAMDLSPGETLEITLKRVKDEPNDDDD